MRLYNTVLTISPKSSTGCVHIHGFQAGAEVVDQEQLDPRDHTGHVDGAVAIEDHPRQPIIEFSQLECPVEGLVCDFKVYGSCAVYDTDITGWRISLK